MGAVSHLTWPTAAHGTATEGLGSRNRPVQQTFSGARESVWVGFVRHHLSVAGSTQRPGISWLHVAALTTQDRHSSSADPARRELLRSLPRATWGRVMALRVVSLSPRRVSIHSGRAPLRVASPRFHIAGWWSLAAQASTMARQTATRTDITQGLPWVLIERRKRRAPAFRSEHGAVVVGRGSGHSPLAAWRCSNASRSTPIASGSGAVPTQVPASVNTSTVGVSASNQQM